LCNVAWQIQALGLQKATIYLPCRAVNAAPEKGDRSMIGKISRDELKAKLARNEPIVLVEALPEKYFRHSHLPGALNIPHDEVETLAPALLPDKAAAIVVYCANAACKNSGIAAAALARLGYANVSAYEAGKADWIDAGLPIEGSATRYAA
jgi:rhodanese-related sulfurtransferase